MSKQSRHVKDLGQLEGPVTLFGGPYSNAQATEALIAAARGHLICTGDVVAYCAGIRQTIDLIRRNDVQVIAGNCEKQLAEKSDNCGCGFDEGTTCDLLSAGWYGFANVQVSEADRIWMAQLPDIVTFVQAGKRFAVLHGGVSDIARFIWPTSERAVFEEEWRLLEALAGPVDGVIAGHCGLAFDRATDGGHWINAGVIGMPANDGVTQTHYAVLSDGDVSFHRLSYDAQSASAEMRAAGLIQGYHESLLTGYWPSEDVLPADLRRSEALANG